MTAVNVVGPDRGRETIVGAVRETDCFLFIGESQNRNDGSKNLLLSYGHCRVDIRENGRLDKITGVTGPLAAADRLRPFATTALDITEYTRHLFLRNQRAHGDSVFDRISQAKFRRALR